MGDVGGAGAWLVERSRTLFASFLAAREVVRVAALQGRPVAIRVAQVLLSAFTQSQYAAMLVPNGPQR